MITSTLSCILLLTLQQAPPVGNAQEPPTGGEIVTMARLFPEDSMAVVSMQPLEPHKDALTATGAGKLFSSMKTQWVSGTLGPKLAEFGLDPADVQTILAGGFSLGVTAIESDQRAHWLFVTNVQGRARKMRAALAKAHKMLESQGNSLSSESVHKIDVWTLTSGQGDQLSYAIDDEMILVGDQLKTVEAAINRRVRAKTSLATAQTYRRYTERCMAEGSPIATIFVQPGPIVTALLSQIPPNYRPVAERVVGKMEIARISELGMSFYASDGVISDFAWLGYPEPRSGLVASFLNSQKKIGMDRLSGVTPDAISASVFTLDLAQIYDEILGLAQMFDESMPQMAAMTLQNLKMKTRVDIELDILRMLGTEAVYQEWGSTSGTVSSSALTLSLKPGHRIGDALEHLSETLGMRKTTVGDRTAYVLGNVPGTGTDLSIVVEEGHLIVANSSAGAMKVAKCLESGAANEHMLRDFEALTNPVVSFSWCDCVKLGEHWLRNLSIEYGQREVADELVAILRETGGSMISGVQATPDGFATRSSSPFGNPYLTLSGAYFMRTRLGGFLPGDAEPDISQKQKPEVPQQVTDLRQLVRAELDYRGMCARDADKDNVGEFADLEALVQAKVLGSRWTKQQDTSGRFVADGYQYEVFLPKSTDSQEAHFLAFAWPTDKKTGTVYTATADGTIHENAIIAHAEGLAKCDPRDFFQFGKFGSKPLPGWERIDVKGAEVAQADTPVEKTLSGEDEENFGKIVQAEKTKEVTPEILNLLGASNPEVAARAAYALGSLKHKAAVPQLCATVKEYDNVLVQRQAMAALCRIRDQRAKSVARDALSSSDAEVRRYAAQTLGFLRAGGARDKLLGVLSADSEQDAPDRIAALLALADIGDPACLVDAGAAIENPGPKDEQALVYLFQTLSVRLEAVEETKTLITILDSESEQLRKYAIQRLGILKQPSSIKALEGRLAKETSLQDLIEVSLDAARGGSNEPVGMEGFLPTAKAKALEAWQFTRKWWNSLSQNEQYYVGGGGVLFLLVLVVLRRASRRRRLRQEGENWAAMVAPSEDFEAESQEEYEEQYETQSSYFDDSAEEGEYEEDAVAYEDGEVEYEDGDGEYESEEYAEEEYAEEDSEAPAEETGSFLDRMS